MFAALHGVYNALLKKSPRHTKNVRRPSFSKRVIHFRFTQDRAAKNTSVAKDVCDAACLPLQGEDGQRPDGVIKNALLKIKQMGMALLRRQKGNIKLYGFHCFIAHP